MTRRTIVVLGGALAGPTAAARAREIDEDARIVLVERNRRVSYAQCGLAYHLSGEVASIDDLDQERSGFFENVFGIEVLTETEAVALDARAKTVLLNHNGRQEAIIYDALILALGAASRIPETIRAGAENVICFRTLDDLRTIESALTTSARRIAVIGGGPMGLEAVDGLVRCGAEVTLIEQSSRLLNGFGQRVSAAARRALDSKVRVITTASVEAVELNGSRIAALLLSTADRIETDLVISAAGLSPRTELFSRAGGRLEADGTVTVSDRCETSLAGVYACGVCVSVPQVITGQPAWLPQGAIADKTAQVAGANAAGASTTLSPALGSMLIRVLDATVGRTGLTRDQAIKHLGTDAAVTTVHAPSHDRYYPDSSLLLVQLFWQRSTGRVVGVEAAGELGIDKRIDAAAAIISAGLTVEAAANLDFGYEPPYNAARDPLNVAATVAASERAGLGRLIEPEDLAKQLASAQIIDVRRTGSNAFKPIAGSITVPLEDLRNRLDTLDPARPVVTVSENGRRGWLAARILRQRGFREALTLAGGLRAWDLAREQGGER